MTLIYEVVLSSQFKKDLKKARKQHKDISKLDTVIDFLSHNNDLPSRYKNHLLTGNWFGYQECHIQPDWLLIYRINGSSIYLARLGSHSDLFSK